MVTLTPGLHDYLWRDRATGTVYHVDFTVRPVLVTPTTYTLALSGWALNNGNWEIYIENSKLLVRRTPTGTPAPYSRYAPADLLLRVDDFTGRLLYGK